MSGIINTAGSKSGVIGELIGNQSGTCSFLARRTSDPSWASLGENDKCAFDNDSTGEGHDTDSCYDTSTYEFTAPGTGVYLFWYAIYTAGTNDNNGFQFKKNNMSGGFDINTSGANLLTYATSEAGDHTQNGTMVIPLATNDTVSICASGTSDIYIAHSSWGGCRLK